MFHVMSKMMEAISIVIVSGKSSVIFFMTFSLEMKSLFILYVEFKKTKKNQC